MTGNRSNYINKHFHNQDEQLTIDNSAVNYNYTISNGGDTAVRSVLTHPHHRRSVPGPGSTMQANDDFMQSPLVTWVCNSLLLVHSNWIDDIVTLFCLFACLLFFCVVPFQEHGRFRFCAF